ncbi:DUF7537 family lipoprotein [Haloplanus halophilus]|uniref:DUF7537 family lipoprotein n=1 Tax=Haloplanus halophilus TaxID=2949993 RepID=UPI0020419E55|nr:hypothetical protein [Haloplanus sp. GDY1]
MTSSRVLTLLFVVLTVTAGCLGGGAAEAVAEAEEASGAAAGGPAEDGPALTDPEAALREAGSFTVTWRYAGVDASGTRSEVRYEYYADLNAGRSLTVTSSSRDGVSDAGSSEQFVADGVTYVRAGPATATTYVAYEGGSDALGSALAHSQARTYGATDGLVDRGTERFDGVTVTRYELSGADSALIRAGSTTAGSPGAAEVTDFRYVVLVDADGLARYESWSVAGRTAEGEAVSGEWEYTLAGVGSTTVEDPEWLAAARTATGR